MLEKKTVIEEFDDATIDMSPEERVLAEGLDVREAIIANSKAIRSFDQIGYDEEAINNMLNKLNKNI